MYNSFYLTFFIIFFIKLNLKVGKISVWTWANLWYQVDGIKASPEWHILWGVKVMQCLVTTKSGPRKDRWTGELVCWKQSYVNAGYAIKVSGQWLGHLKPVRMSMLNAATVSMCTSELQKRPLSVCAFPHELFKNGLRSMTSSPRWWFPDLPDFKLIKRQSSPQKICC